MIGLIFDNVMFEIRRLGDDDPGPDMYCFDPHLEIPYVCVTEDYTIEEIECLFREHVMPHLRRCETCGESDFCGHGFSEDEH